MGKNAIRKFMALTLVCTAFLTGCSSDSDKDKVQKVEGLEDYGTIKVITREEGSGTRAVFAEKLGLVKSSAGSDSKDEIIGTAQVAENADDVIASVEKDAKAVGYVSLGALPESLDKVKVIQVAGVQAEKKTVADGSYLLSRDFNIAYSGELSDVEADFLSYIVSAGQDIVSDGYMAVANATTFLSDQSEGTITIEGSTSVEPLMQKLVEEYESINEHAKIEIKATDSTSGLNAAMQGTCDLAMASRDLKDYEQELLEYRTIASDGIAVIVNEENPVQSLTVKQLADIYSGEDVQWNDINK